MQETEGITGEKITAIAAMTEEVVVTETEEAVEIGVEEVVETEDIKIS